ncbi:hypothetical protein X975_22407, partial [Stegodyphus mimosarum]
MSCCSATRQRVEPPSQPTTTRWSARAAEAHLSDCVSDAEPILSGTQMLQSKRPLTEVSARKENKALSASASLLIKLFMTIKTPMMFFVCKCHSKKATVL